ncbi:DUF6301 family protein [Arachnia propionica]|uniref:DUF6301 family protein n=1 Tax=Arachnia propionica TaxID=1750 RepID=UPI0030D12CB8
MIIFPPRDFITWTNRLMQFPWPIQLNDFPPYAEQMGWKPTLRPSCFNVYDDEIGNATLRADKSGSICRVSLVTANNETGDAEGAAELNDLFASYATAGRRAWGEAFFLGTGDDPVVVWKFSNESFAEITGGSDALLFWFTTPQGQWHFT